MQGRVVAALSALVLVACQPTEIELEEAERVALIDTALMVHADLVAAAEQADVELLLSFFSEDVGLIIDGEVVDYESFVDQVRRGYAALDHQEIQWHPAKAAVVSRDAVALTLGGTYTAVSTAGDTVAGGKVAWSELLVRQRDNTWKITEAHQSFPPR
ncbi:MAG: hypothetical protein AMS18_16245 [Gemmatimonas sp. SG8_17]|nr:MAG: hypothetical protein AMS18_16245 [Gemmatimonas sp. SG8_17]